jgi:hypothetical protein
MFSKFFVFLALAATTFAGSINSGMVGLTLNTFVDQSSPLTPGGSSYLLSEYVATTTSSESVRISAFNVHILSTGTVGVQNLSLWSNDVLIGMIIQPTSGDNIFSLNLHLPANLANRLDVRVDILAGSSGAIQSSIQPGGLVGFGVSSNIAISAPDVELLGGVHQICDVCSGGGSGGGSLANAPEPTTFFLFIFGLATGANFLRK